MKKSKKLIGIVLSLILAISITATIFVATANTKETDIIITVDKAELSAGESAIVSAKVTSNYPIATMSIPVFYDKTLVDVSDVTPTLTDYAVKSAITDTESADPTKIYANTDIDSDKFGFVLATYIGGAGKEVPETTDDLVLTFIITAKTGVSGTEIIKCVSQSAKTDENVAGMLYFGATTNGKMIDSVPENVENLNLEQAQANVKIGSAVPELLVSEYGSSKGVVVDKVSFNANGQGFIYGINTDMGEMIENYFGTPAGSVVVTPNAMGVISTGATVELVDDNGTVLETYSFIFFGDYNGDGFVDAADLTFVEGIAGWVDFDYMAGDGTCETMAADVNGDGFIDAADLTYVEGVAGWMDFPAQSDTAAVVAATKGI